MFEYHMLYVLYPFVTYLLTLPRNSNDQVKEGEMGRACRMRENGSAYTVLVGNSEGKRPLGRRKCGWEDNMHIKMDSSWLRIETI
jgi:hypothetical protein